MICSTQLRLDNTQQRYVDHPAQPRGVECSAGAPWSAFACWNVACRFWPIITKVDKKIASSDTIRVSVGQGLDSTNSIQTANITTCA